MIRDVRPTIGIAAVSALVVVAASCFGGGQAVRVSPEGGEGANRWQATLSSPRSLAGAVDISGTAWMAPGEERGTTRAAIRIQNATPGGVHPWEVHRGRCGSDAGVMGSQGHYEPLEVNDDGLAEAAVTLPVRPPEEGDYFVVIYASPNNRDLTIACGNLAPPTG